MTDAHIDAPTARAEADAGEPDGCVTVYVRTSGGWQETRLDAGEVIEITDHRGIELAYVEVDEDDEDADE